MIEVTPHAQGCVVAVRAQPGAKKNGVVGEHAGALKLAVTAPPDRGRANKALAELLRELIGLKRAQVELLSGATSHDKRFLLIGVTTDEAQTRIHRLLSPP